MMYILYDTALNGLYTLSLLQKIYPDNISLFKGTKDEHLFDVAPYLFRIDDLFFQNITDPYISLQAVTVLESDRKLNDLHEHFTHFIYQRTDGRENYFRFWDARVLARFLPACSDKKLDSFFDGIKSFYEPDQEKGTAKKYFIKRAKLQSDILPLSKLFVLTNDSEEEILVASGSEDEPKKTKRTFFK